MNYERNNFVCILVHEELYAMGDNHVVEKIETEMIELRSWTVIDDSVIPNNTQFAAVKAVEFTIFMVAGSIPVPGSVDGDHQDTVYTVDTVSGKVSLSADRLPFTLDSPALIAVQGTLYSFGGWIGGCCG